MLSFNFQKNDHINNLSKEPIIYNEGDISKITRGLL